MSTKYYTVAAYGTLVVDVYLALVAVATKMDVRHLPPFGAEGVTDGSRLPLGAEVTRATTDRSDSDRESLEPVSKHQPQGASPRLFSDMSQWNRGLRPTAD